MKKPVAINYTETWQLEDCREMLRSPPRRAVTVIEQKEEDEEITDIYLNKEWQDILRYVNISPVELERLAKNDNLDKIIEAVELMNKLLLDKNCEIKHLKRSVDELLNENAYLNAENVELSKMIQTAKENLKVLEENKRLEIEELTKRIKDLERKEEKVKKMFVGSGKEWFFK